MTSRLCASIYVPHFLKSTKKTQSELDDQNYFQMAWRSVNDLKIDMILRPEMGHFLFQTMSKNAIIGPFIVYAIV